jgi:membrane-associated phospholipid phosphatase
MRPEHLVSKPKPGAAESPWRRGVRQALILGVVLGASLSLYLTVLKWRGPAVVWVTQTAWDREIPFWPGWVWVYLLPYAVGPVLAAFLSPGAFRWFVRHAVVLVLVSLVVFVLWPSQTVRPPADHLGDGLTARVYRNMVELDDPPANAAPSLHVSMTCLLALVLIADRPRWWPVAAGATLLVCLATLLTWQHHLIDVVTGAALAGVVALVGRPRRAAGAR